MSGTINVEDSKKSIEVAKKVLKNYLKMKNNEKRGKEKKFDSTFRRLNYCTFF